ncbi:MAG: hypothetical protein MUO76_18085 [Anaerolineaceae bacterium]|nr:hypothetical protein [Anaerolineaceae bacterium]
MDIKTRALCNNILIRGYLILLISLTACNSGDLRTIPSPIQESGSPLTDAPLPQLTEEIQISTITLLPPTATILPIDTSVPSPEFQAEEEHPCDNWEIYSDQEYAFTFCYAPDWTTHRTEHRDINGELISGIDISKNEYKLSIQYWKEIENIEIAETGIGAGEIKDLASLSFFGQEIQKSALIYQDKTKNIFYSDPDGFVNVNELVFVVVLSYTMDGSYEIIDIPAEIQVEVDEILKSFTR